MLKTRMPLVTSGDALLGIFIGTPSVELGASVNVRDMSSMKTIRDLIVKDVVVTELMDISDTMLQTLGYHNFSELRLAINNISVVGLPAEADITIVVFGTPDNEFVEGTQEEVEADDSDDILPLVYPGDEDEGDDFPA